ncbi:Hpt domain-containing protein [Rhizobium sp. SSA_523]|uniref:Hpt domain-containing protein n=1 Tax=Rhizobium sp. SSA_523 TaxID=2952477 RepID=UPI0020916532|nr:Hpt domain-containing protein [Rhizobium sp. SSA_523]MCO5729989.1 Hpt domain-containing protein [Rhizobium sp. SSA_523]WKC25064.1 Hpt domain-containing protein [Rhizobium sp. SSA_523]
MGAVNIAFEAPDNTGNASAIHRRPVDLVHLAVQTMGDKALELEVLHLFTRQARATLQDIAVLDRAGVTASAHRLKSAANGVGAFMVAAAAEKLEANPADAGHRAAIGAAVLEAENFILKLTR